MLPDTHPRSSRFPYRPICGKCGKGYGSELDGLCTKCRGCDALTMLAKKDKDNGSRTNI